jgi:CRP-like cAMP-binding protein
MNIPSALARKLQSFTDLSEKETSAIDALHKRRKKFVAGQDMVSQGLCDQSAYILTSGWACSYKILEDGQRQIVDFQIPGDFLGLRSILLNVSDHSIEPVTDIEAVKITLNDIIETVANTPKLAVAMLWAMSRDEAMVVEHLVGLGRRDAAQRVAHFLLELGARLSLVGLATKNGFFCGLTQYLLADALGLTAVHINRTLRQLREAGLLTFRDGLVSFDNYKRLVSFAQFDPCYMDHKEPFLD